MDASRLSTGIRSVKSVRARVLCLMTILACLGAGCKPEPKTPLPQNGPNPSIEAPATFEGTIFRDDFTGQISPEWTWQNQDASRHKLNDDGWLEITGGDESILTDGQQANLLWIDLPKGDFEIMLHLKSQPLFDFQQAGFLLYQDAENYLTLNRGYCMECVLGGEGVFLEYSSNGNRGRFAAGVSASDLYLVLVVEQGVISAFYAIEEDQRQHLASLKNTFNFRRAALSVTNGSTWDEGYDIVGSFDFFEIRRPTHFTPKPTPIFFQQA